MNKNLENHDINASLRLNNISYTCRSQKTVRCIDTIEDDNVQ